MSNITISSLPEQFTVLDNSFFATETSSITQKISAASVRNYLTQLPNITVSGTANLTVSTSAQPFITSVGNLTSLNVVGQITSLVSSGTAPLVINSNTLVPNLYVARAQVADSTTNGLTTISVFANSAVSDATITGAYNSLTATLKPVNSNVGQFGGMSGTSVVVPQLVVNNKGLVTSAANVTVNLDLGTAAVTEIIGTPNQIVASAPRGNVTLSLPSLVTVNTLTATTLNSGNVSATGTVSATQMYDGGIRVVSNVNPISGNGISITNVVRSGPNATFTITNTGILGINAGTGIIASVVNGVATLSTNSVTAVTGNVGITAITSNGSVSITPTLGWNGYGQRFISQGTPTGGSDGDIWYQI